MFNCLDDHATKFDIDDCRNIRGALTARICTTNNTENIQNSPVGLLRTLFAKHFVLSQKFRASELAIRFFDRRLQIQSTH